MACCCAARLAILAARPANHFATAPGGLFAAAPGGLLQETAMSEDAIVIASYARTPMGGFMGALGGVKATDLGAAAVRAALERAGVDGAAVERIYMGCVLPAGLG